VRMAGCQGRNSQLVDHGCLTISHLQSADLQRLFVLKRVELSEICIHISDGGLRAARPCGAIFPTRFS
jgi:hypothetical protein